MDKIDRVFLMEYVQSLFMGHTATASALYDGAVHAEDTAAKVRMHFEKMPYEEAKKEANRLRDASRVQAVMIAKILAEYVSAMEDFGALCYSIKNRNSGSIFKNYVKSFKQVNDYFTEINGNKEGLLDSYLKLPSLKSLSTFEDKEFLNGLKYDYENCAKTIRDVANMYFNPGITLSGSIKDDQSYSPKDVIYIILDVKKKGIEQQNNAKISGLLVRAYNKIKHRFSVFESLDDLVKATENYAIEYAVYPRDPKKTELIYFSIYSIAQNTAELAAIMLKLDEYELL